MCCFGLVPALGPGNHALGYNPASFSARKSLVQRDEPESEADFQPEVSPKSGAERSLEDDRGTSHRPYSQPGLGGRQPASGHRAYRPGFRLRFRPTHASQLRVPRCQKSGQDLSQTVLEEGDRLLQDPDRPPHPKALQNGLHP